jgi:hypothetical protein
MGGIDAQLRSGIAWQLEKKIFVAWTQSRRHHLTVMLKGQGASGASLSTERYSSFR